LTEKSPQELIDYIIEQLKVESTKKMKDQLLEYTKLLYMGLKKQRLTGERTIEGIIVKQLYDSLYPLTVVKNMKRSRILDLGSGGGLPGLPIKIMLPETEMDLIDSNQRKIQFLKEVSTTLGLKKVKHICGRAEEWGHDQNHREKYDYVTSKAVAELAVLSELALPFLKIGGRALLYKGPHWQEEAEFAKTAIESCGGATDAIWHYKLLTGEKRVIFMIKKSDITPARYPRAVGKPAKRPLGS